MLRHVTLFWAESQLFHSSSLSVNNVGGKDRYLLLLLLLQRPRMRNEGSFQRRVFQLRLTVAKLGYTVRFKGHAKGHDSLPL